MTSIQPKSLAIACASGSFKGAFTHGVLSALETTGIIGDAYAAASSSVLPTAWATIGKANQLGIEYWLAGMPYLQQPGIGMSQIVLGGIKNFSPPTELFAPTTPEFIVATSAVVTSEAASETQTDKARRLGRKLLVAAAKKQRAWVSEHLQLELFSTKSDNLHLNATNFDEVTYASSRMLHAWDIPAWVNNKPYIDASYTCMCPAIELVNAGYQQVIAISNEPGVLYRDMFQLEEIYESYNGADIYIIKPDVDTKELGVDFTDATEEGLRAVYQHGLEKGRSFCIKLNNGAC
jgi:predicted patatin/cPLA2 family phospholipase